MEIRYATRTLANGLEVVVHEDRHIPMAAVSVWYHVGSRHERPGRTGFAHLFEHLMFKGSAHHPSGYFEALQQAGALVNGSTNTDRTNYWEVVPADALELALWLESDRMGHLLPALSEEKFTTEREVVLNERRQNYENRPYGLTSVALAEALYTPDHPYSWVTIGAPAICGRRHWTTPARSFSASTTRATPRWSSPATSWPRRCSRSSSGTLAICPPAPM